MVRVRWLRLAGLVVLVLSGSAGSSADASVEIGQLGNGGIGCAPGQSWLQDPSTTAPPGYSVPAGGGTVVSWRTGGTSGTVRLKVYRRSSDPLHPEQFLVVGQSAPQVLSASNQGPFSINPGIAVAAGDTIGFAVLAG